MRVIDEKHLRTWAGGYLRHLARGLVSRTRRGTRHLLFAFCDHYEPLWGNASKAVGLARLRAWVDGYPRMSADYRDGNGRGPQHTFFYPGEQYEPEFLEGLARLAEAGHGEVEVHLHHDGDTSEKLRDSLRAHVDAYASHGHLSRDQTGRIRYGFIHGNWCLANARRDGRHCGVDDEIPLLFETGCYADFTFPSAPDESQPNIVNRLYWPTGNLRAARAYETGERARVGTVHRDRILMVEGPLALSFKERSLRPRIENAAITARDPATPSRIRTWVAQNIHVDERPEWVFVKVHTHGAPEQQAASLLGDGGRMLHRELCSTYNDGKRWKLHYLTAREMFNVAIAAMEGAEGDPDDYRDHVLPPPPVTT